MKAKTPPERLPQDLGQALLQTGTVALFPSLLGNQRTSPAQPAMFLVYLCGTWIAVKFVILLLAYFGIMPNPNFPWGFLRAVQPGMSSVFVELSVSLLLTLVVYVRFFYRYNDYLYHLNPTKTPLDFLLDCLVAISGVAIIIAVGNCTLLTGSFAALFLFAGLKYLQGHLVCVARAQQEKNDVEAAGLWRVNAIVMKTKFTYDLWWCGLFITLAISGRTISSLASAVLLGILIPTQLLYMYFGEPAQIALRAMDLAPPPWMTLCRSLPRLFRTWRPYSVPYVSLIGLCGVLSGERQPSWGDVILALTLGPMMWVSMLAFHDFAHKRADQASERDRPGAHWVLVPFGLVMLFAVVAFGALAGQATAVLIAFSALLGILYGVVKGLVLIPNVARGFVTFMGILSVGTIVGLTQQALLIAAGLGLLDAAGNVLGDLRDSDVDAKSNTRTIALVSPRSGIYAWAVLFFGAIAILVVQFPVVAPLAVVGSATAILSSPKAAHLQFLLFKYTFAGVVALTLQGSRSNVLVVSALLLLSIPAVASYRRIHMKRMRESDSEAASINCSP